MQNRSQTAQANSFGNSKSHGNYFPSIPNERIISVDIGRTMTLLLVNNYECISIILRKTLKKNIVHLESPAALL